MLPLVPAYLGMLTGLSLEREAADRRLVLLHAVLFVLGFSLLFVLWGAAATALGRLLGQHLPWIQRLGGVGLVVLGLHLLGVVRIPFLYRERSLRSESLRPGAGYLASFMAGAFFFSGWVPCVGPVLAAILMLSASSQTVGQGALLLAVYSLGLGIPFVAMALFAGYLVQWVRRFGRASRWVEVASGVMVILIGLAVFFDTLVVLSQYPSWFGI